VLFPGTVQFLHLFEKRYRIMFKHLLERDKDQRLIAMAHLRPGYQAKYHTNHAEIYPMVCVALVVRHEGLQDGRYNLLVRGLCRARIRKELRDGAYRLAWLQGLREGHVPLTSPEHRRLLRGLRRAMGAPALASLPCGQFCRDLFDSDLHLATLADLLAFHLLPAEATDIKQLLLEELDVVARAEMLLKEMQTLGRKIETGHHVCSDWPPAGYAN
jgi:Lon protease-like protein